MSLQENDVSNYLVLIKLGGDLTKSRIAETATAVKEIIDRISNAKNKLIFSSSDACSFGFFVEVKMNASLVSATLRGETKITHSSPLLNDDSLLVLEIGQDWAAYGFSNSWHWIQNH